MDLHQGRRRTSPFLQRRLRQGHGSVDHCRETSEISMTLKSCCRNAILSKGLLHSIGLIKRTIETKYPRRDEPQHGQISYFTLHSDGSFFGFKDK